jgi:hypothetical protein
MKHATNSTPGIWTPEGMAKAVKAEQASHSFKSRWTSTYANTTAGTERLKRTRALENSIAAEMAAMLGTAK